ncbi:MAG: T9SS type A sorting domain-containing protein [Saprospiraceae bacterium]
MHFTPGIGHGGYGELNGHRIYFEPRGESLSRLVDGGVLSTQGEEYEGTAGCPSSGFEEHGIDGVRGAEHCDAIVDVLFLRSPLAEQQLPLPGGIATFEDIVIKAVNNTNESLSNTKIGSKVVNPLFHTGTVDINITCTNCQGILGEVKNSILLQQLREQYNADVVVYYHEWDIVTDNCGGASASIGADYGSAFIVNSVLAESSLRLPFTVTAHELGHVFRGEHVSGHIFQSPNTPAPTNYATLMPGALFQNSEFVLHYSNPDVDYTTTTGDVPTGELLFADNAIRMTDHFCVVADLEQSGSFSSAVKDNRAFVTPCFTSAPLCALTSSGNSGGPNSGPYTYEWRWSLHPNASTTLFSTDECVNFVPPLSSVTQYYVTLEVTDINSGQSALSSQYVSFHYCNDFDPLQSFKGNEQLLENESSGLSITSTPTQISITFIEAEVKSVEATLYSLDGRVVAHQASSANFVLPTHHLPSGLYRLKVMNAESQLLSNTSIWHFR